ncbi:unnamed protein product, partial [Iphiclides podalirius]
MRGRSPPPHHPPPSAARATADDASNYVQLCLLCRGPPSASTPRPGRRTRIPAEAQLRLTYCVKIRNSALFLDNS